MDEADEAVNLALDGGEMARPVERPWVLARLFRAVPLRAMRTWIRCPVVVVGS